MKIKVLIVEDEFLEANNLQIILERAGYYIYDIATSVEEALAILKTETPDLVLLDIFLKGKKTGIDLAEVLNQKEIAFIYLSANSNAEILLAAKKTEPYGFLVKPFREKDILITLDIAHYLHEQKQKFSLRRVNLQPFDPANFPGIIGNSDTLKSVLANVQLVAPTDTSVLILGESGTGKERIADLIHHFSNRKDQPFIKVNCTALPESIIESELFGHERGAFTGAAEAHIGKFERSHNGTIFLDEIGELPLELQSKLLRVLQEKEIERLGGKIVIPLNTRIIAATNRNLELDVDGGRFRMDLYYRLNVFPILMPALRDRKEDIPVLAQYFVEKFAKNIHKKVIGVSEKALKSLMEYDWPGNIRELEHLIERLVILTEEKYVTEVNLGVSIKTRAIQVIGNNLVKTISEIEKAHIIEVLKLANGKIFGSGGAAELLSIPHSTLTSKIKKLGQEVF